MGSGSIVLQGLNGKVHVKIERLSHWAEQKPCHKKRGTEKNPAGTNERLQPKP
jgi:hypothetical protein